MQTQSVTPALQDKALWVTILGLFLPLVSAKLGIQLDPAKIAAIVVTVVSFVVSHKAKSGAILLKELELKALSQVTVTPESK